MRGREDADQLIRPKLKESDPREAGEDRGLMAGEAVAIGEDRVEGVEDVLNDEVQPEANAETRQVQGVKTPYKPSAREIADHNLTHLNYRSWCPTCVQGRGVSDPHRRGLDKSERSVAAVHADYCFMSRDPKLEKEAEEEENIEGKPESETVGSKIVEKAIILTVKDAQTGCLRPHLVPSKGIAGAAWIGKAIADDLTLWGHNNCIFKSDQEASMVAVYTEAARMRAPYRLVPEHSPKGDSQANGSVERANRSVKGQVRVMILALEAHLGKKIDLRHAIVAWMVTHAGYILTHYEVGKDGRTAYERLKGKTNGVDLCEFGEKVHYMPLKRSGGGLASAEARYKVGIWLGVDEKSSERIIGTLDGTVVGARSVKRLPEEDKWDAEAIEQLKGVPWSVSGADGMPEVAFREPDPESAHAPLPVPRPEMPVPRRMMIRRSDLDEYGFTVGCPGCDAQLASRRSGDRLATRAHTEECRARLLEAIRQTPEGRRRIDEAVERIFEHVGRQGPENAEDPPPDPAGAAPATPAPVPAAADPQTEAAQGAYETEVERAFRERLGRPPPWTPTDTAGAPAVSRKRNADVPAGDADDLEVPQSSRMRPRSPTESMASDADLEAYPEAAQESASAPIPRIVGPAAVLPPPAPAVPADVDVPPSPMDSIELNIFREILMIREPLIPILHNIDQMREIADKLADLDWEAGKLAALVLGDTHGGRELSEFKPQADEFLGLRLPYNRPAGSNGDLPPVTDDAGLDHVQDDENKTGPQAKPEGRHHRRQWRASKQGPQSWMREDRWTSAHVTTAPSGPEWKDVEKRVVYDLDTDEMIEDIVIDQKLNEDEYHYQISSVASPDTGRNIRTVLTFRASKPDVSEVYSPPRIVAEAARQGLKPGFSLDLTVQREDGDQWDFSRKRHRDEATRMVVQDEPYCLIGSPPCTMFSVLQNGNRWRFTESDWNRKLAEAEVHIEFCLTLYEIQRRAGRFYLHEHPRTATSWKLRSMGRFECYSDTIYVDANMCQFGMVTNHRGEQGLVQKATTFMTNSHEIATRLDRRCSVEHRERIKHLPVWGERAREAQIYPPALCQAVAEGIRAQKMIGETNLCGLELRDLGIVDEDITPIDLQHDDEDQDLIWEAWDDVTGKELKPALVKAARSEEMKYVSDMGVYDVSAVADCWWITGKAPIRSRWVDINKGDDQRPNYRSRWVAQQIRTDKGQWELFAGTPPLEAIRYLVSVCASMKGARLMTNDISRAYFFADVKDDIFVELPAEAEHGGDKSKCARLRKALYGTRAAASCWAECYTDILIKNGFTKGKSSPCLFHHADRDILTLVHGDDFMSTAKAAELDWLNNVLRKELAVKTEILGPAGEKDAKQQIMFLNRVITWEAAGIRYEADPRHAEIIVSQMGLEGTNPRGVSTPGVKDAFIRCEDDGENPQMSAQDASGYRGLAARANFLSQDRLDLQYASKELSRAMAVPRQGDWEPMKRFARYLLLRPRATLFYGWQSMPTEITAYSDTDWAGCKSTRRSTSGGVILHGSHVLRSWSKMQNLVAMSSAEAELYGTVRASCELLGVRSLARDYGRWLDGRLYADASAALGIIHRQGLGKLRHLDTSTLWVQQAARAKLIEYIKVPGEDNPADILTKHLAAEPRERHAARCGLIYLEGRAAIAPRVCADDIGSFEISRVDTAANQVALRRPAGKGIGERQEKRFSWADACDES